MQYLYLGRVDYGQALALQQEVVDLRHAGRIANTLLLLEHPPVLTLGRNAQRANILASDEMLARGGLLRPILKERWAPVVGAVWITYRRSLALGARYELATRLVGWDERWFYMEQVFTGDDGLAAVGWVKGALRDHAGVVAPQRVLDLVQPGIVSPELPEAIATLNELTREKLQGAS